MKTHNDEQETKTTERPAVSGCGENHACDKAKAEDFEITEEMTNAGYEAFIEYHGVLDTYSVVQRVYTAMVRAS